MPTPASTTQENKTLMRQIFDGIARGDATLFYERVADDATMTITGEYSWSQTFRGKQAISQNLYGYVRSQLSQRGITHAFHFLADEDWVVVEARGDMVSRSGEAYRNHYCLLYRLRDGMIVEMKEYQDSAMCERILGPFPARLRQDAQPQAGA